MDNVVVELKHIRKEFPGVVALDDMSLQLRKGEVHGLIGENGAGKSTLIKTITGVNIPEQGDIFVDGKKTVFHGPAESKAKGIACVYQELNIVKELPIVDNLFLGSHVKNKSGFLDYAYMNKKTEEVMASMGQKISASEICGRLGMGQQQMVEIGRAILQDARVIILDEPTSSLGERESEELFKAVRILKEKNIAVLFISHKLEEIFEICDIVTVMRDGKHISTKPSKDMTKDSLIADMVGRTLENLYPRLEHKPGEAALEVSGLTKMGQYYNVSFQAMRGEILGFSGLVGAGRTELMHGIFGSTVPDSGEIKINGSKVAIKSPQDAIRKGIAFLTEDRKQEGLVLTESIARNLSLVNLKKIRKGMFIDFSKVKKQADACVAKLKIATPSIQKNAGELSGGNQQKVVIGKWMNQDADIYIFDEPTRGIDVGAKIEVYNLMNELLTAGKCVIMVSSDLQEVLGMCDRIIIMREGKVRGELSSKDDHFNQEDIMKLAWGGKLDD
ncbi:sugar ABC transporter ATP-binding protein [Ruminococcus gauvreauii]|uniref:sugar ABC transporter ATP-binding protein n=1 Tax=Ruminococcus gauvreauii TaxID=438033 RepID=UPI003983F4C5